MTRPHDPVTATRTPRPKDRTLWVAWAGSLGVLALAALYLWFKAAATDSAAPSLGEFLLGLPLGELAQFVIATAISVAFLWFVAGWRRQSVELALQREELALQREALCLQQEHAQRLTEQATAQLEVLKDAGRTARRESFARLLELYERKLALEASQISSMTAIDAAASAEHQQAWSDYERGDRNALFRILIRQLTHVGPRVFMERVDQIANGRALLERYAATAAEILNEATAVDDRLARLCWSSEWAYLFQLLDRARTPRPAEAVRSA